MKTKTQTENALPELLKERGNFCISVIVPTHRTSPDRRADKTNMKKALDNVKQLLEMKYLTGVKASLINKLTGLYHGIDFDHSENGIGLFVSANVSLHISFPFEVDEKIVIGDSFEIRDVLYKANYSYPYHVLLLTAHNVKLFMGLWTELTEIKDEYFPARYKEEYVYARPNRSTSYAGQAHVKSFEKDKSQLEAIRYGSFFRTIGKMLNKYRIENDCLIIIGAKKLIALFDSSFSHKKYIMGKIAGGYSHLNPKLLSDLTSPLMFDYFQKRNNELIAEFEEKIGSNLAAYGIQDAWKFVMEGRAFKLIIEKDFRRPAFLDGKNKLYLKVPKKPHIVLSDAVDDLIEVVLKKGGKAFFVANGSLKSYKNIAVINRY